MEEYNIIIYYYYRHSIRTWTQQNSTKTDTAVVVPACNYENTEEIADAVKNSPVCTGETTSAGQWYVPANWTLDDTTNP